MMSRGSRLQGVRLAMAAVVLVAAGASARAQGEVTTTPVPREGVP